MITKGLGLLGIIAIGSGIAAQLKADRAAMETLLPTDLAQSSSPTADLDSMGKF